MRFLVFFFFIASFCHASNEHEKFINFFSHNYYHFDIEYLNRIYDGTEKWAYRVGLESQIDTLLCMAHRESEFDEFSDDGLGKRRSLGIYQIRVQYKKELIQFWLHRGYKLKTDSIYDIDNQCAFGVAEFYLHLKRSKGNVYGAVRRYNGSGKNAYRYANRVFKSRKIIFKRPHYENEKCLKTTIKP